VGGKENLVEKESAAKKRGKKRKIHKRKKTKRRKKCGKKDGVLGEYIIAKEDNEGLRYFKLYYIILYNIMSADGEAMEIEEGEQEQKEESFMEVEKIFRDRMDVAYDQQHRSITHQSICCDEAEAAQYIIFADQLKTIQPYDQLSLKDIYKVLIFTDYSLDKNEGWSWLKMKDLQRIFFEPAKYDLALQLFHDITTGEGPDISTVRRFILKMPGGKKRKKRRRKTRRKRKLRRKRRKSKPKRKTKRRKKRTRKR
jgi:hypothetical protein